MNNDKSWRDEFDIVEVDHWEVPDKNDARILTQPNIVYPLHSLAPRTVLGATVWNHMRKATYAAANNVCEICGYRPSGENGDYMHCLERGTEVLTVDGWKKIESITTSDIVAQYNKDNKKITWVNPISTTSHYEKGIYKFGYRKGFSVGVSSGHRMLIFDCRKKKYETVTAENLRVGTWVNIPSSGIGCGDEHLSDDERLKIAIQADGSLARRNSDGMYVYRIIVKREDKKERLRQLISRTSLRAVEKTAPSEKKRGYVGFCVWIKTDCKKFSSSFDITKMSFQKASEFLDELVRWDGWSGTRKGRPSRCYYSSDKDNIDFVQAVCAQCSLGSHVSVTHRKERFWGDLRKVGNNLSTNLKPAYNLEIKKTNSYGLQTMNKTFVEYNDDVFCITVPDSYFVARTKGGDVFITGNCHEMYDVDYAKQEATFVRTIGICKKCHLMCIHTGRALTLYKQGSPLYTKERLLEGAEHCFTIISSWNREHPEDEPLRVFSAWLDYLKQPDLEKPMRELIKKYDIKFYKVSEKWWNRKRWSNWKLRIGNKWYNTPYADRQAWEKAMAAKDKDPHDDHGKKSNLSGGVFDEIDKFLKENAE